MREIQLTTATVLRVSSVNLFTQERGDDHDDTADVKDDRRGSSHIQECLGGASAAHFPILKTSAAHSHILPPPGPVMT